MLKRLRLFLLPAAMFLLFATANAQFRYTFKDTTTAYAPLTGASSLNGTTIWDDDDFTASIPFTWKLDSTLTQTNFKLSLAYDGVYDNLTATTNMNGFIFCDADIADRGTLNGTSSLSPISYLTTGSTPNRIFKLEIANGGFLDEQVNYFTMNDSFSLQIWVYETSNIVEYHYGPSRITHPMDYFSTGTGPLTCYAKHADFDMASSGKLYYLKGNPASPTLDTDVLPSFPATLLNSWPASGKVYRFSPRGPACALPVASFNAGLPSGKTVQYTYNGTTTGIDSLIWNWGDGTANQKVTSGYTTPLSHTFANNGRYTVTVTAYNACGSNVSTRQVSLAVGDLAGLGNVKVYPNPATTMLFVEGLGHGGSAVVRSAVGQVVMRSEMNSGGKEALSVAALPAGVYSLTLTNAAGAIGITRFTKQ